MELTDVQTARAEEMAASFAEIIKAGGTPPTFEQYQETTTPAEIPEVYLAAFKLAEHKAATEWGYGPAAGKKLSRQAWDALPPFDQAKFIREGGRLYDPPMPDTQSIQVITNRKGDSVTRGEFEKWTPQQQSQFSLDR